MGASQPVEREQFLLQKIHKFAVKQLKRLGGISNADKERIREKARLNERTFKEFFVMSRESYIEKSEHDAFCTALKDYIDKKVKQGLIIFSKKEESFAEKLFHQIEFGSARRKKEDNNVFKKIMVIPREITSLGGRKEMQATEKQDVVSEPTPEGKRASIAWNSEKASKLRFIEQKLDLESLFKDVNKCKLQSGISHSVIYKLKYAKQPFVRIESLKQLHSFLKVKFSNALDKDMIPARERNTLREAIDFVCSLEIVTPTRNSSGKTLSTKNVVDTINRRMDQPYDIENIEIVPWTKDHVQALSTLVGTLTIAYSMMYNNCSVSKDIFDGLRNKPTEVKVQKGTVLRMALFFLHNGWKKRDWKIIPSNNFNKYLQAMWVLCDELGLDSELKAFQDNNLEAKEKFLNTIQKLFNLSEKMGDPPVEGFVRTNGTIGRPAAQNSTIEAPSVTTETKAPKSEKKANTPEQLPLVIPTEKKEEIPTTQPETDSIKDTPKKSTFVEKVEKLNVGTGDPPVQEAVQTSNSKDNTDIPDEFKSQEDFEEFGNSEQLDDFMVDVEADEQSDVSPDDEFIKQMRKIADEERNDFEVASYKRKLKELTLEYILKIQKNIPRKIFQKMLELNDQGSNSEGSLEIKNLDRYFDIILDIKNL